MSYFEIELVGNPGYWIRLRRAEYEIIAIQEEIKRQQLITSKNYETQQNEQNNGKH